MFAPYQDASAIETLKSRGIQSLFFWYDSPKYFGASMDVLSSTASLAGCEAVHLQLKIAAVFSQCSWLPAAQIKPAKALILVQESQACKPLPQQKARCCWQKYSIPVKLQRRSSKSVAKVVEVEGARTIKPQEDMPWNKLKSSLTDKRQLIQDKAS